MTINEERMLRKHVDDLNEDSEGLQEVKIKSAMRRGIVEGKKREKRRFYTTGIGVVAVAAAVFMFTSSSIELPGMGNPKPSVQTASPTNTDNFKAYRTFSRLDPALASALEQNLVIPVGQSAENNGYRVDVTGAVTDGRQVYILYSVQNNTNKEVIHADISLQYEGINEASLHKGAVLNMLASESRIQPGQTVDFIYSSKLSPSVTYPNEVNYKVVLTKTSDKALSSSSNKYRTTLDVAFDLDPDMLKEQERILQTDSTLTVDGQKIKVNQVQYTPLSTYVDLEIDQNNSKQVFELMNPVLISKKGDTTEKIYYPTIINSNNSDVYADDSKFTLVFKNSPSGLNNQADTVSLKTFGISAVEKDQMKIVFDLNKQQIIEAPGSGLELVSPNLENKANEGDLLLRHNIENAAYLKYHTSLADTFTDADGTVHERGYNVNTSVNFGSVMTSQDGKVEEELYFKFGEKAKDYPQPLTIALKRFMNPISDTQSVELYSK